MLPQSSRSASKSDQKYLFSEKKENSRSKYLKKDSANLIGSGKFGLKGTNGQSRVPKLGYVTPMEVINLKESHGLPLKSVQTTQKKKSSQTTTTRPRLKTQAFGQMKIAKVSSIDFSNPAMSPKRDNFFEANSNTDIISQTSKTLNRKEDRTTPRHQPISNFQIQQEQAKLIKNRQMNNSQKMNLTAFGTSSILTKGKEVSQSYNNFVGDKQCNKQQQTTIQPNSVLPKKEKALTSHYNLLVNYQNSISQTLTAKQKGKSSNNVSCTEKEFSLAGSVQTSKGQVKSSIFVTATAKQNTSSVSNTKQVMIGNPRSVKPFSVETNEPDSSQSLYENASPEPETNSHAPVGVLKASQPIQTQSKADKQHKEKQKNLLQGAGTSSSILHQHLKKLNANQMSYTSLQTVTSQLKEKESCPKGSSNSGWNSTVNNMVQQKIKTESSSMNFAKPTISSSQACAISHIIKSATLPKESSSIGGFPSHTAARAGAKRGFFKENGGTASMISVACTQKSSAAVLPEPSPLINDQNAIDYKQISKVKKKEPKAVPAGFSKKRQSNSANYTAHTAAYMTTETGQNFRIDRLEPEESNAKIEKPLITKLAELPAFNSNPSQIFQGSTRQRTNTTSNIQPNKNSAMRLSTNNLTLQNLMSSSVATGTAVMKSQKITSRGPGQEKTTMAVSASQSLMWPTNNAQKQSSLAKSSIAQLLKETPVAVICPVSEKVQAFQINERMETLTGGVKTSKSKKSVTNVGPRRSKRSSDGAGPKIRSQSALKNHSHTGTAIPNTILGNFTSQPSEVIQRKSNPQHTIIMAAAADNIVHEQSSGRKDTQTSVPGSRNGHEGKRASVPANNLTKTKEWGLADFEKAQYGDRCPRGYEKLSLLGKGGCAVVWLAREMHTGRKVALKQFPKPKSSTGQSIYGAGVLDPTAKIEIEMGRMLFPENNAAHSGYSIDPVEFPGILKIARLYAVLEETKDVWLAYQVGGQCLTNHLFEVKGEFYKGERIYGVQHQDFYRALKEDKQVLVDLITMLAQVFDVLAMFRIVHADIKPDNILIDFDGRRLKDIKLIDFGSAFSYENPSKISATTPAYLAPEVLEYLELRAQNTDAHGTNSTNLCKMQEPWSYDMWSMGAILLEILTGIPLWMSLKCRAHTSTGKQLFGMGIFGVQGRQNKKILQKQTASLKNLQQTLKKYGCYGLDKDPVFMDLLVKMLDPNPITRISPIEVLEHPFIKDKVNQANAN